MERELHSYHTTKYTSTLLFCLHPTLSKSEFRAVSRVDDSAGEPSVARKSQSQPVGQLLTSTYVDF